MVNYGGEQNYAFTHKEFGIQIYVEFEAKRKSAKISITFSPRLSDIFSEGDDEELCEHTIVRASLLPTNNSDDKPEPLDRLKVRKAGLEYAKSIVSIMNIEQTGRERTPITQGSFAQGKGKFKVQKGRTFFAVLFSDGQKNHDALFHCKFDYLAIMEGESGFVVNRAGFGSWKDQL